MNERIAKLAEQCTVSCIDGRGVELNEIDVEKFAELIAQECIDILSRPPAAMLGKVKLNRYNQGWVNGRLLGIEHIKENFGIK
jgi:hypothetical protein